MIERLLILVLTCGVFLGVWRHDARQQRSWRTAHRQQRAQADDPGRAGDRVSRRQTDDGLVGPATRTPMVKRTAPQTEANDRRLPPGDAFAEVSAAAASLDLPLPKVIVPGNFRVVNHRGFVGQVRIGETDLAILGLSRGQEPRNLHTIHTPDGPCYLIRLTPPSSKATGAADAGDQPQPTGPAIRRLRVMRQMVAGASEFYRCELSPRGNDVAARVGRLVHRGRERIMHGWNSWRSPERLSVQPSKTIR